MQNLKCFAKFQNEIRSKSTQLLKSGFTPIFVNRNPRNLEKLRIGYKPDGYHLDNPGKCYWHKLNLEISGRYVIASISHFKYGEIIKASTSEWCINKFLYRTKDTSAFINLGRVLAQRCLQAGIIKISCYITPPKENGKDASFLQALTDAGISLFEPPQYKPSYPWDQNRPEKPWEIIE